MKKLYWVATAAVVIIGLPVVYIVGSALVDGELRRRKTPFEALFGQEMYEVLSTGAYSEWHYLGEDKLAPDFSLKDQRGQSWSLRDQRGKVVIMNFWTVDCKPCLEEMPSLQRLALMLQDRDDIELVTISTDANWEIVRSVIPPNSGMQVLLDPDKRVVTKKFGTKLYPETWFIDPRGVIRARYDGARDWSTALTLDIAEACM